ncbi:MAG: protein jag [Chloroflexi bacterium]|nr:protein jag [Chloroflexota bacterium]
MESLEVSAKTVSEAIQQALAMLGKSLEEVDISVLSEGNRGILGIGGEDARILVSVRSGPEEPSLDQVGAQAKQILETLLTGMHVSAVVSVVPADEMEEENSPITLNIEGDDMGMLIGRRGETLGSLQFIVNLIVGKQVHRWTRVVVDVAGYRSRRTETLKGLAVRMAERVRLTHQPIALEAMPAHERRIVHLALQESPHATTQSVGEGEERKVVIMPKK